MDDLQINQLAKSLEAEIAQREIESDTKLQFTSCEKPSACFVVTANRSGCLELARMFLMAAIKPIEVSDSRSKPVTLMYPDMQVPSDDRQKDLVLVGVQRMELWPEPFNAIQERKAKYRWRNRFGLFGCALFAVVLIALLYGGVQFYWMVFTGRIK